MMDTLQVISSIATTEAPTYDFFFNRLDYCLSKGRGFSLFNADDASIASFLEQCGRKGFNPFIIKFSALEDALSNMPDSPQFVVVIQDLSYAGSLKQASLVADKFIFPLWFRGIPICFFSYPGRGVYEVFHVSGEELHKDPSAVVNLLLGEQVFTLLERSNYQFTSPHFLNLAENKTIFSPIEEKLLLALEAHNLSYQPQVRIGRYTVDFLVGVNDRKIIVECDGKAYHDAARDSERDKVLSLEGYPICRFSGSELYADVDKCIEMIRQTLSSKTGSLYILDGDLDSSQHEAIKRVNGPIRVLAPAGSGKTKTLINRILHLRNQGIPAEKILALAFNKKACDEMQDRLDRRAVDGVEVRTFHSFGYEIVREGLGWCFNGPSSKKTSKELMMSAILEHTELPALRGRDPLDAFLDGLRRAKMELPALSTVTVEYGDRIYPLEAIFYSYIKNQLATNFLDFDDMIYLAIRTLLSNSSMRHAYQSRFEYVLVDEFQDLNEAQLLLLQIISLPENNIFAVGDDDQMIYGFRGADVKHIVDFDKRFPISSTHVLNTNYRSSRMIVRHSGWLINHNVDRVSKNIQPKKDAQTGIFEVSAHKSLYEQAEYAVKWLVKHRQEHSLNWRDYAILYRNNAFQLPVSVLLDAMNVPHPPLSGRHLFQSRPGRDIYSYLKVVLFPAEATAADFERILNRPNKYFTNQLIDQAQNWDSFTRLPETPNLRGWEREKLLDFINRINCSSKQISTPGISAVDCMQMLKTEFSLADFYRDQSRKSDDLDEASDDVLLDVIIALAENFKTPMDFYQYIRKAIADNDSSSDNDTETGNSGNRDHENNEVYLSTIHKAKGKEFRNVIYFNLSKTDAKNKQTELIEEERRVAYVGVTRPKEDLLITFSSNKPSNFLMEIALNPRFKTVNNNELRRSSASRTRQLRKEKIIFEQMVAEKGEATTLFNELTQQHAGQGPIWLHGLIWKYQNWRITHTSERIERIDLKIKKHLETVIVPLSGELSEIEEEENMRTVIGVNQ
jgi:superfamily I DNA/RNA helicase/very-short-patch-repair endonuclease